MGGGGKGGSTKTTTKIELPKYVEEAARSNLDIADEVAAIGYIPYRGPTVAALTPMQRAAMNNTNDAAAAFGMGSGENWQNRGVEGQARASQVDPLTGMTTGPTRYNGGVMGYSPVNIYGQAKSKIPEAQRQYIESFTINPYTGAQPANPTVPTTQFQADPNHPNRALSRNYQDMLKARRDGISGGASMLGGKASGQPKPAGQSGLSYMMNEKYTPPVSPQSQALNKMTMGSK